MAEGNGNLVYGVRYKYAPKDNNERIFYPALLSGFNAVVKLAILKT